MSSQVEPLARLTTTLPFSSSHSMTEPGARPSLCLTLEGTEICPCAVNRDCAMAILKVYITMVKSLGYCVVSLRRQHGAEPLRCAPADRTLGGYDQVGE